MSGDHTKYHGTAEVVKDEGEEYMRYDEDYVAGLLDRIDKLKEALAEAVYLLNPLQEDMHRKENVYRLLTALEKLNQENT